MKNNEIKFKKEIDHLIENISKRFRSEIPLTDIKIKIKIKKHRCRNFVNKIKKLMNKQKRENRMTFLAGIPNNAKMVDLKKKKKEIAIKENGKSFTFKTGNVNL